MSFIWKPWCEESLETEEGKEVYAQLKKDLECDLSSWSGSSIEIQVYRGNVNYWSDVKNPKQQRQAFLDEKYRSNYRRVVIDIRVLNLGGRLDPPLRPSSVKVMEAHSKMNTRFEIQHRLGKKVKFVRPPPAAHWRSMFENSLNDIKREKEMALKSKKESEVQLKLSEALSNEKMAWGLDPPFSDAHKWHYGGSTQQILEAMYDGFALVSPGLEDKAEFMSTAMKSRGLQYPMPEDSPPCKPMTEEEKRQVARAQLDWVCGRCNCPKETEVDDTEEVMSTNTRMYRGNVLDWAETSNPQLPFPKPLPMLEPYQSQEDEE